MFATKQKQVFPLHKAGENVSVVCIPLFACTGKVELFSKYAAVSDVVPLVICLIHEYAPTNMQAVDEIGIAPPFMHKSQGIHSFIYSLGTSACAGHFVPSPGHIYTMHKQTHKHYRNTEIVHLAKSSDININRAHTKQYLRI